MKTERIQEMLEDYELRLDEGAYMPNEHEKLLMMDFVLGLLDEMETTITCVYCGMTYPKGTPPHGNQILTDHIKVCEKHPMREAEEKINKLRSALTGLVGVSTEKDLKEMEIILRTTFPGISRNPLAPSGDLAKMIDAIHVLLETSDE